MTSMHCFQSAGKNLSWALERSSRECLELTVGPQSIDSHALLGNLDLFAPFLEQVLFELLEDPDKHLHRVGNRRSNSVSSSSTFQQHHYHHHQEVISVKIHLEGFEFMGDPPTFIRDLEVPLSEAKEGELVKKHVSKMGADITLASSRSTKIPPKKCVDGSYYSDPRGNSSEGDMYKSSGLWKDFVFPSPRRTLALEEQVAAVMKKLTKGLFCTPTLEGAPVRATPKFFKEQRDLSSAIHPTLSQSSSSSSTGVVLGSSIKSSSSSASKLRTSMPVGVMLSGVHVTFTFEVLTEVAAVPALVNTAEDYETQSPAMMVGPPSSIHPTTNATGQQSLNTTVDYIAASTTTSSASSHVTKEQEDHDEEVEVLSELSDDAPVVEVSPTDESRSKSSITKPPASGSTPVCQSTSSSRLQSSLAEQTRHVRSFSTLRVTTIPIGSSSTGSFLKRELLLAHRTNRCGTLKSFFEPSLHTSHCVIVCEESQRRIWNDFLEARSSDPESQTAGSAPTDDTALLLQHLKHASANEYQLKRFVSTLEAKVQALEIHLDMTSQEKASCLFQMDALRDDLDVVCSKNQALEALLVQKQASWDEQRQKFERRILEGSSASVSFGGCTTCSSEEQGGDDSHFFSPNLQQRLGLKDCPTMSDSPSALLSVPRVEQLTSSLNKELQHLRSELDQHKLLTTTGATFGHSTTATEKSVADVGVQVAVLDRIRRWK